ncbi:hypothetical protein BDV96DRAFT_358674 [Lophiotrema nucula]|uniref:Uncharacterized protein n=1 Tax=Lophiotrema nucula TaxID=690887 RepID=A0A6A5YFH6_9PLEO|nr:hypothetical protein BDV96DRAFT_358674 [Lophiotrema nucula]
MTVAKLPDPHSAASHAHPPPTEHASSSALRSVIDSFDPVVRLRGLPGFERPKVSDVFCPDVRRPGYPADFAVNHLDVVFCWKGLSYSQAREIKAWEEVFHDALGSMIFQSVLQTFTEYLGESIDVETEEAVLIQFIAFLNNSGPRLIHIDVPQLVYNMIDAFRVVEANQVHSWFSTSDNLPATVCRFIQTRDCFTDSFPSPCVEVTLHLTTAIGSRLGISGEVNWFPPNVEFDDIPSKLASGEEYYIRPSFVERRLVSELRPQLLSLPAEATFYISSTTLPMVWDEKKGGFRVYVPSLKERYRGLQRSKLHSKGFLNPEQAEATLSATIVRCFPGGVRFEQITRYSIKLNIQDSANRHHIHATSCSMPATSQGGLSHEQSMAPYEKRLQDKEDLMEMKRQRLADHARELRVESKRLQDMFDKLMRKTFHGLPGDILPVQLVSGSGVNSDGDNPLVDVDKQATPVYFDVDDLASAEWKPVARPPGEKSNRLDSSHCHFPQVANPASRSHDSKDDESWQSMEVETSESENSPSAGGSQVPQKRKAPKAHTVASSFRTPTAFEAQNLALDKVERVSEEAHVKRQKLDDDEAWDSALIPNLADGTGELGEVEWTSSASRVTKDHCGQAAGSIPASYYELLSRYLPGKSKVFLTKAARKKGVSMPMWPRWSKASKGIENTSQDVDEGPGSSTVTDDFWPDPRGSSEESEVIYTPSSRNSDSGFCDQVTRPDSKVSTVLAELHSAFSRPDRR